MNPLLSRTALPLLTLMLSGCAVGMDFIRPTPTEDKTYIGSKLEELRGSEGRAGAPQHFAEGAEVPARWWEMFGSPALNQLVEQALAHNPDLKAAQATLKQAQELAKAEAGSLLPSIDAKFTPSRQKISGASFGQPNFPGSIYTLYNASVGVSYALDVFGGERRAVETAQAQAEAQGFQTEAAYLSLTANVVTAAIQEASLRAQIAETQHILDVERRQLDILTRQFELGGVAKVPVLAQQATLAQAEVNLPILQKQLALVQHQLAVLCGNTPAQQPEDTLDLDALTLPQELPLSLPSKLAEQRPDIRAAEAQLHAATAQEGVATAAMFPQLTLNASYGSQSVRFNDLLKSNTDVWSFAGNILQPIFHGGQLLHQKRAAVAAMEAAQERYRSAVLQGFQNVADSLRALQFDAETLNSQAAAAHAAEESLNLQQSQYKFGAVTYISLLDAQRTYQQARIGLVQAQAQRLADTAALMQALGGGWWNRDKPEAAQPETTENTSEKSADSAAQAAPDAHETETQPTPLTDTPKEKEPAHD